MACILERAGHINSASGYLCNLTAKARRGEFALGGGLGWVFGRLCRPRQRKRVSSKCRELPCKVGGGRRINVHFVQERDLKILVYLGKEGKCQGIEIDCTGRIGNLECQMFSRKGRPIRGVDSRQNLYCKNGYLPGPQSSLNFYMPRRRLGNKDRR